MRELRLPVVYAMSDTLELLPRVTAAFEITTGERYALGVLANLPVLHCVGRRPGVLATGVMLPVPRGLRSELDMKWSAYHER